MNDGGGSRRNAYVPDIIPITDLRTYEKAGLGHRIGFGRTPAILVVDATRAFVEDKFPLGNSSMGQPAVRAIRRLLDGARAVGIPVFFTRMEPFKTRSECGRWFDAAPGVNSNSGDPQAMEGAAFPVAIRPLPSEVVITKPKPSAFFGTQLHSMLVYNRIDTLIVAGMVTSGCVRATVDDAFAYNYRVIVPVECVADRAEIPHQVNLFDMGMISADILPLGEVLDYVATRGGMRSE